jgi:hypothetical protein
MPPVENWSPLKVLRPYGAAVKLRKLDRKFETDRENVYSKDPIMSVAEIVG